MRLLQIFSSLLCLGVSIAHAASLTQVTNFGSNPTGVGMFIYVPAVLAPNPPILVAIHFCQGTAQAYFTGTRYSSLADQYGFIVIYPNAPDPGGCFDVHSNATLLHNSGGDSLGIASQIRYTLSTYNANPNRVFVTGSSSGAMMTNVLAGAYPDLIQGAAAFSGVPDTCFAGPTLWNSACADGTIIQTPQQWGDLARGSYPGYTGPRPKIQLWHGTADTTLYFPNLGEEVKQWTNIFGVSQTPTSTLANSPSQGWTRSYYGSNVVAVIATGVGHPVPVQENDVLSFFGLNSAAPAQPTSLPSTPTAPPASPTPTPTPVPTSTGTVAEWGQCGGIGYTGSTVCAAGFICTYSNAYYSQCLV